ncbi:MAG: hypothetical protein ACJ764_15535 [Solirubrobacteraceae bacterium]
MNSTPPMRARDAGLALISRINRWMIAGAVGLAGLISFVAAQSFHGRTLTKRVASQGSSAGSSSSAPNSSSSAGGIQPPSEAPSSVPVTPEPSSPVVTGGS